MRLNPVTRYERGRVTDGVGQINRTVIVSPIDERGRFRSKNAKYAQACKLAVPTKSRSDPAYKWVKAERIGYIY